MKLGRACTRCGSCMAVVATNTLARLPAISFTSAPHSGSQAKTFIAADADETIAHKPTESNNQGHRKVSDIGMFITCAAHERNYSMPFVECSDATNCRSCCASVNRRQAPHRSM